MSSKMDENLPVKIFKNLCCPSCNLQFLIKDFTLKGYRCPLLLHCGHSMCGLCIQQNLKFSSNINCQQCGSVSSLESQELTSDCFPPNMYLVGSLLFLQNLRLFKDKRLPFTMKSCRNFNYVVKELSNPHLKENPEKTCEECSFAAVWYCENCKSNFCEICWSRVHGSAKSLMKHCKSAMSLSNAKNTYVKKCPEHETQDLEFFCQSCTTAICPHCAILQHQGENHVLITLKNKNLVMNNIKTAAEEAKKICKRMKQTLEKVKLTENSYDGPEKLYSDLEDQITRNFSRIHGVLQFEEERLLKKLRESSNERRSSIQALRLQLEEQIENVESLLSECEFVEGELQTRDVFGLHTRLKEMQNLPCYLISRKPTSGKAKVAFDERLIGSIQSYCTMDLPSNEVFELRSSFDLPKDYAIEPLQVFDVDNILEIHSKTESESRVSEVDALSFCSLRDRGAKDFQSEVTKPSKGTPVFQEKKTYSVRVSYIKNPGEFYVTLNSQRSKKQAIDKRASQYAEATSCLPQTIAKDEIYLAKYTADNRWYRARVKKVFPPTKIGEEERVKVYYLDYGNTETLSASRLRSLPPDLTELPLAIKCKLFDCVPKHGEWCAESTKTMEKILNHYTATMFIMKVQRDCLEVDLSVVYPDGEIGRDIVSVRDALLFLEFSTFVHGYKIPRNGTASKLLDQRIPPVGESFHVIITHVNSPSDFFVQNVDQDLSYLRRLTADLQIFYSDTSEKGIIYNPTVGMPCAAFNSLNQLWYRARIVDVPGKKMVTVFYLDYGNTKTISWTSIRILKESFLKLPPLGLNCELVGIVPTGGIWCGQAKLCLEKYLSRKGFRIYVSGKLNSKRKLGVFLYKQRKQEEICVNALLVDKGYAVKTFSDCWWVLKSEEREDDVFEDFILRSEQGEEYSEEDDEDLNSVMDDDPLGWGKGRSYQVSGTQNRSWSTIKEKESQKLYETVKEDCSETFSTDNIFQMKVKVLSAESPASIHVTFPSLMQQFEELQAELYEFYQNSSPVAVEWTEGSVCAVYIPADDSWYRASILCVLPDDHVKVVLKDLARITVGQKSALRELDPSFNKYPSCSVKCHLADIEPAGKQWPTVSSEFLLNELKKYKEIYMTKCGQIENKSLPVKLWVHKIFPTGALEPSPKEWITLNRLLVKEGLAVPKKQNTHVPDEEHSNDVKPQEGEKAVCEVSDENLTKEEPKESISFLPPLITQWQPPEPLKDSDFIGMPTYVDFKGYIHIYDIEKDGKTMNVIREALQEEFKNSTLKSDADEIFWIKGQPCVARYHLDNSWYRGVILETNEDGTYNVLFIDYGNTEKCESRDLREVIKVHDIPILSHKFQLQDVVPLTENGEWPIPVIDLLHSLVVDKKCKVQIVKQSVDPGEPSVINLQLVENEVDVGGFLVAQGLASFTCSISDTSCTQASDILTPEKPSSISSDVKVACE